MLAFAEMGRLDEARSARSRALALALQQEPQTAILALTMPSLLALRLASPADERTNADRALELADALGGGFPRVCALVGQAIWDCVLGQPASAVQRLMESLEIAQRRNVGLFNVPMTHGFLACAHLLAGDTPAALQVALNATSVTRERGLRMCEVGAQQMLARAFAADGQLDEANCALDRAMSVAREIGAVAWEPVIELTAEAITDGPDHPGLRTRAAYDRLSEFGGEPVMPPPAYRISL